MSGPPKFTPAKVDTSKNAKKPATDVTTSPSGSRGKDAKGKGKAAKIEKKKSGRSLVKDGKADSIPSNNGTSNNVDSPPNKVAPQVSNDISESEKDKEIDSLKAKIKKYEAELRRSDDTILVQEEEIKRLSKRLNEAGVGTSGAITSPTSTSPPTKDAPDSESEGSEKSSSKKGKRQGSKGGSETKKKPTSAIDTSSTTRKSLSAREKDGSSYPLVHFNLREGTMKDSFCDLALTITAGSSGGASGTVNAHAYIASVRCPKFDKALKERYLSKDKKKAKIPKKKSLDLRGSDVTTISRLLDYLYSDECYNIAKFKPIDLLNLVIAARRYSLDRLIWMIESEVLRILGLDNVVTFLKASNELKDDRIKKFCMDYLLMPETFKEFVLRKDLTNELGMELFSEIVTLNATGTARTMEKLGECPPPRIREDFKELYSSMMYADACVTINGETIQFHKAILAASSKSIYDSFNKAKVTSGQLEDVSECLELTKDQRFYEKLSPEAFKSLLKFVYYGERSIEPLPGCLLIPFAKSYGLNDLQELCEKIISQSVSNSKVVLKIMGVTYLAIMAAREEMRDRLRRECIQHCMGHLKEINLGEIKNFEAEYALNLALDLLLACQKTFAK